MDSFYETAIRQGHHIIGLPIVIAEWNYNQIFQPTVTNPPDDQDWALGKKYFPPQSVSNTIRPASTGILAAVTDEAYTASEDSLGIEGSRYYSVGGDTEETFIYWMCPTISHLEVLGSGGASEADEDLVESYAVDRGTLLLEYPNYVNVNKVKVLFNLGPTPVDWSLFLHTEGAPGDGYIEVTDIDIDPITGRAAIWWDGDAWVQTQQLDESVFTRVDKVRIEVNSVDQPEARLQIVELAAGREADLTSRMSEYSVNFTMDEVDFIHPVGKLSSDDGEIVFTLNNEDFEADEFINDFRDLLVGRCQYRLYINYDLTDYGGTNWVCRTGTMYANDWKQTNEYEFSVELWDVIKILQTKKCPEHLFEFMPIAKIVAQMLDFIGVDTYAMSPDDFDASNYVKYFWTDGTETVYDAINRLCESSQCAVYVDEFGVINLLSKTDIANELDDSVWTLRGEIEAANLPDIETLTRKYSLQANQVTIKYKQMEAPVDALDITGQPLTSKVWETSDTVVLRASPLLTTVSADGLAHVATDSQPVQAYDIWMNATRVVSWPYKGKVNIDGELIEYDGKGYTYWDFGNGTENPTVVEVIIYSDEEKKKWDQFSYNSFVSVGPVINGIDYSLVGGISWDPAKQNKFNGRLHVLKRDAAGTGRQTEHSVYWNYGWMPMKAWLLAPGNSNFPTRYVEPGGSVYNMSNLKNYKQKPNWNSVQTRWSVQNSIVSCNNVPYSDGHPACLIRDLGGSEYRELGTRFRINGARGYAGILFYLSNATGYDNVNPTLTDPLLATRWYMVTVATTEEIENSGRAFNEITLEVKNGNTLTKFKSVAAISGTAGKWQIDGDKWYDLDLVVRDSSNATDGYDAGGTQIEVYIDGQWVDTFITNDNIRATGLVGLQTKWGSKVDYEYFYAINGGNNQRPSYLNDDDFYSDIVQLPAGSNLTKQINLPTSEINGAQSVISLSTLGTNATIHSLKVKGGGKPGWLGGPTGNGEQLNNIRNLGSFIIKPDTRVTLDFDGVVNTASVVEINYTATNGISLCYESTTIKDFKYSEDINATPINSYWDGDSYSSLRLDDIAFTNVIYPLYWSYESTQNQNRQLFMDDFGAVVREVRDFDVEYDVSPAKGVRVYISNDRVRVMDHEYNPSRGIFTLVNASHSDEIVNGTEEIDEANSVDHSLMLYGYIIEDKGDKTKIVKDDLSMRRYGAISIDLDANWIFNEDDATALGDWIIGHWSDPMDSIDLTVFSNTFLQIGDKVNILYSNANIDPDWLYIVSGRNTVFNDNGLATTLSVRRVR